MLEYDVVYLITLVSAANVALLSCMHVLLCKFILVTVQINIHLFILTLAIPQISLGDRKFKMVT